LSRLEERPLEGNFLGEFFPEVWPGDPDGEPVTRTQKERLDALGEFSPEFWADDSDGETVTTTQNDRLAAFRKTEKGGEDYARERNSADGLTCNTSPIWNPSRDQWIVIWVCSLAAWLLWSADNAGGYGILGRTALFGDHTDHRFGTLAILIGVLRTWQLESRRKKSDSIAPGHAESLGDIVETGSTEITKSSR
jgi:hypothetical protein